jgi:hypothetical protein
VTAQTLDESAAAVAVGDFASLADLLLAGFPDPAGVSYALDSLPGIVLPGVRVRRAVGGLSVAARIMLGPAKGGWGQAEGPHGAVVCAAGVVQLVAGDLSRAERSRVAADGRPARSLNFGRRVDFSDGTSLMVDPTTGEVLDGSTEVPRRTRGRITAWSKKSRANLIRRMSSTDWRPMLAWSAAPMVTTSYPGPWTAFAPTRRHVARHLEAFKESYRRAFCRDAGVPVMGAWKIEYQRRGAPHLHILLPIPPGMTLHAYRAWVRETWHRIIWADGGPTLLRLLALIGHDADAAAAIYAEHESRSLWAGTAVDEAEGARLRDPRRIALYFLGHSLSHAADGGKEYQHVVPPSYAGRAGRWWGIWGCEDTSEVRYVDAGTWWALREALAAYAESQGRIAFQGGRMFGGWLAVEDGPAVLREVAGVLTGR